MLEPFDYDTWLGTPPEPYTEPEEDEDEAERG